MGIIEWFRRKPFPVCTTSTFGVLHYEQSSWTGRVTFPPINEEVVVILVSDGSEPSALYTGLFAELVRRYAELQPAIGVALFELWKPYLDNWRSDRSPRARSAEALVRLTTLDSVHLELPARVRLSYGFVDGFGWDDATLTVELKEWLVSGGYLSD